MSQSSAAARVPTRPVARPAARERVQQPRLRVVAPAPRRSAGGLALLSVGLLGLGLLVLLLLNISIGKGAYALTALQRQQRQLVEDRQMLAEQVEAASAPDKLAERASKLGMVPNPNPVFVEIPNGKVQGKPEVATAPPPPVLKSERTAKKSAGAAAAAAAAGKKRVEQDTAAKKAADEKSARAGQKAGQGTGTQAAKRTESTP
jgi:hypothetical protein